MSKKQILYEKYIVDKREEYDALKQRGIDILFWNRELVLTHRLRVEIQQDIFGRGNHQDANQKFYRMAWEGSAAPMDRGHFCQECHRHLENYSATYISHILSRGAHPEMAYDLRNFNILCPACHQKWENGDRQKMRIWNKNEIIMNTLKKEYGETEI